MFNILKQWKLIIKISANRNGKKLTVSRKKAKHLNVNRKSYHPIETLLSFSIFFRISLTGRMSALPKFFSTIGFSHLHNNVFERICEAILGNFTFCPKLTHNHVKKHCNANEKS